MFKRMFSGEKPPSGDRKDMKRESSWQERALEGMATRDAQTIREIRQTMSQISPGNNWYYGGAFKDFSPLMLSPKDSKHTWVDQAYSPGCRWYHDDCAESVAGAFKPLGVESQVSDTEKPNGHKIIIDKETTIEQVPGDIYDEETLPENIDVVYYTGLTPPPIQALRALKEKGIFLTDAEGKRKIFQYAEGLNLEDLGFRKVKLKNNTVKNWKFPSLDTSDYQPSMNDKQVDFTVWQKIRDLTPEESNLLKFESALRMINSAIYAYMTSFRANDQEDQYLKNQLELAFRSCSKAVQDANSGMEDNLEAIKDTVQYMATELPGTLVDQIADEFKDLAPERIAYIKKTFEKFSILDS